MAFESISLEVLDYWERTLKEVDGAHEVYLHSGPQARLLVKPMITYPKKWDVIENRMRVLIVGLLPAQIREQITGAALLSKRTSVVEMLYLTACDSGQGALGDKVAMLQVLTTPKEYNGATESLRAMRHWLVNMRRTELLHAALPDPALLVMALSTMSRGCASSNPTVLWRWQGFMARYNLPHAANMDAVKALYSFLEAELKELQGGTALIDATITSSTTAGLTTATAKSLQNKGKDGGGKGTQRLAQEQGKV